MACTVSKRVEITMNLVEKLIQTLIKDSCLVFLHHYSLSWFEMQAAMWGWQCGSIKYQTDWMSTFASCYIFLWGLHHKYQPKFDDKSEYFAQNGWHEERPTRPILRSHGLFTKDLAAYPKSSDNGFLGGIDMVFDRGSTFGRSHRLNIRSLLARCLCASSIEVVAYITRFIMVHRGLV